MQLTLDETAEAAHPNEVNEPAESNAARTQSYANPKSSNCQTYANTDKICSARNQKDTVTACSQMHAHAVHTSQRLVNQHRR